jgi:hypothetical protein
LLMICWRIRKEVRQWEQQITFKLLVKLLAQNSMEISQQMGEIATTVIIMCDPHRKRWSQIAHNNWHDPHQDRWSRLP